MAISLANKAPFKTEAERNVKVAEARFLRAIYYFNAVEQFGGVTMITEPASSMNFAPTRTEPLTIYKEIIIPDLEFAVEWLDKGNDATTTQPTKKLHLECWQKFVCRPKSMLRMSIYLRRLMQLKADN